MADPFSVAVTAVGITSLGFQTCQILYNYCSALQNQRVDIENLLKQLRTLQGTFESLLEFTTHFETDNHTPALQLQLALEASQIALNDLKHMVDKRDPTQSSGNTQARLDNVKKRILWPCKERTLKNFQAALSRVQDNLSLALQYAGFDEVLRELGTVLPALHAILLQGNRVEKSLAQSEISLEILHNMVQRISLAQQQHTTHVSRQLSNVQELAQQLPESETMTDPIESVSFSTLLFEVLSISDWHLGLHGTL